MTDYNAASQTYDNTRTSSERKIDEMNKKVQFQAIENVLDFGCGTGNYLREISRSYSVKCHGVEPSDGMREKALEKNQGMVIKKGNHEHIPFDSDAFDFIYMIDVIHHIPDLPLLFKEFGRVLKEDGLICISTQSHKQIEKRFYNRFFPSLVQNEKERYPDIPVIIQRGQQNGFALEEIREVNEKSRAVISDQFIKLVREKGFSMFRELSEEEFSAGLRMVKENKGRELDCRGAGETLVWLKRQ